MFLVLIGCQKIPSELGMTTKTSEEEVKPEEELIPDPEIVPYLTTGKPYGRGTLGRPVTSVGKKLKEYKERKRFIAINKHNQVIEKSKFDLFWDEFSKNGGNGTRAVMKVEGIENYQVAANKAHYYINRAKYVGRMIMEKEGITYEKLIKLAWEKAQESRDTAYFDRLLKMLGHDDFISKQVEPGTSVSVNINQAQKETRDEYGFGDAVDGELEEDG